MIVSTKQTNNRNNPNFYGTVKPTFLYNHCAKKYAKTIKVTDNDWYKLKFFINTIRNIKTDNASKELFIDTLEFSEGKNWGLRYGEYFKKGQTDINLLSYTDSTERTKLGKSVFNQVIEFGIDCFGRKKLKKPIEEFSKIEKHLKMSDLYFNQSRLRKNRAISSKLIKKAQAEIQRAADSVGGSKERVLDRL